MVSVLSQDVGAQLWSFLTQLWEKTGGSLDPFGNPGADPAAEDPSDAGSSDPTGPSGETNDGDTGGSLDPFGGK